jgi:plasmid stability protein
MVNMTIRDLDDDLVGRLRLRAARHGQSVEDEALSILRSALQAEPQSGQSLLDSIRARVEPYGGIELELPEREPMREPPDFL